MEQFSVDLSKLNQRIEEEQNIAKNLTEVGTRLRGIGSSLGFQVRSSSGIQSALKQLAEETDGYGSGMLKLQESLKNIQNYYRTTEQSICGDQPENSVTTPTTDAGFNWKISGTIWKLVENFGVVGKFASMFGTLATEGVDYKNLLGGAKKFVTIVGDLAQNAYSATPDWKSALLGKWAKGSAFSGLDIAKKIEDGTKGVSVGWSTFGQSVEKQLTDFTFKNATTVGDKIKVGAKWAGVGLSAITNGISNYKDFEAGKMDGERAVKETIMETAVDVGTGIVATAAATAGLAALGVAGAPAVAVGAIAVGITWAADAGCRAITKNWLGEEKSLTETISDAILDTEEALTAGAGKVIDAGAKAIGNAVNSMGKSIAKWIPCLG